MSFVVILACLPRGVRSGSGSAVIKEVRCAGGDQEGNMQRTGQNPRGTQRPTAHGPMEAMQRQNPRATSAKTVTMATTQVTGLSNRLTTTQPTGMEHYNWYHGLLPRDDIKILLRKPGDFIVRVAELNKVKKTILSVMWDGRDRHFLIQRNDMGLFCVDKTKGFPTIPELINYYFRSKELLTAESAVKLITPVPKQDWEISHDQVVPGRKIGEGAFGFVYQGILKQGKKKPMEVAIKTSRASKIPPTELLNFMKEARLMRQYDHPNIVKILGVAAKREPLMIVMELVPGGSLLQFLRKTGPLVTPNDKLRFCIHTARGMEYLEGMKCIHRDLAARNCLLGKKKEIKITDFGLAHNAEMFQLTQSGQRLPIKWLAPETLQTGKYTTKTDCWTFGIVAWEIYSGGQEPYPKMKNSEVRKLVETGFRQPPPQGTPSSIHNIMKLCWQQNPHSRPTFKQLRTQLEKLDK